MASPEQSSADQLDLIDRKILRVIQDDVTLSVIAIGEIVGLSSTPCWKRMRRMERDGIITGKVALVDQNKLGLGISAFIMLQSDIHSEDWSARLSELVGTMPEVLECYRMAGDIDYILRVVLPDSQSFAAFRERLSLVVSLKSMSVRVIGSTLGQTTALPISLHRYV